MQMYEICLSVSTKIFVCKDNFSLCKSSLVDWTFVVKTLEVAMFDVVFYKSEIENELVVPDL